MEDDEVAGVLVEWRFAWTRRWGGGCWWLVKGQGNDRLFNPWRAWRAWREANLGGGRESRKGRKGRKGLKAWRMMRLQGCWGKGGLLGRGAGAGVLVELDGQEIGQ